MVYNSISVLTLLSLLLLEISQKKRDSFFQDGWSTLKFKKNFISDALRFVRPLIVIRKFVGKLDNIAVKQDWHSSVQYVFGLDLKVKIDTLKSYKNVSVFF